MQHHKTLHAAVCSAVDDPRFWAKVDLGQDCWEWRGHRDRQGYGKVTRMEVSPAPILAHRYAWRLVNGAIAAGVVIRHTCDNPSCVRPDHLLAGTQQDNITDRQTRGRHRPGHLAGEAHSQAKLTWAQVRDIRSRPRHRGLVTAWAREFGVTRVTLYHVLSGRTWRERAA